MEAEIYPSSSSSQGTMSTEESSYASNEAATIPAKKTAVKKKKKRKSRNHWTHEEDIRCRKAVLEQLNNDPRSNAKINWKAVERKMNTGRSAKQCRERWRLKLDPLLKKTKWTEEEDQVLLEQFDIHGCKWVNISKALEGRSEHSCKSRYHSLKREEKRRKEIKESLLLMRKRKKVEEDLQEKNTRSSAPIVKKQKLPNQVDINNGFNANEHMKLYQMLQQQQIQQLQLISQLQAIGGFNKNISGVPRNPLDQHVLMNPYINYSLLNMSFNGNGIATGLPMNNVKYPAPQMPFMYMAENQLQKSGSKNN